MMSLADIMADVEGGAWLSDIAKKHGVTFAVVRAVMEAQMGQVVPICAECSGSGQKDGQPCKACRDGLKP